MTTKDVRNPFGLTHYARYLLMHWHKVQLGLTTEDPIRPAMNGPWWDNLVRLALWFALRYLNAPPPLQIADVKPGERLSFVTIKKDIYEGYDAGGFFVVDNEGNIVR
jgi:hypothetical protein